MTAQALTALAEAQAVRRERAALMRRLAATRPRAAAIGAGLTVPAAPTPPEAEMSIRELLIALYGLEPLRVQEVLDLTRIDPATALAALTIDDRRRLTRALAGLVGPRPDGRRSAPGR